MGVKKSWKIEKGKNNSIGRKIAGPGGGVVACLRVIRQTH